MRCTLAAVSVRLGTSQTGCSHEGPAIQVSQVSVVKSKITPQDGFLCCWNLMTIIINK